MVEIIHIPWPKKDDPFIPIKPECCGIPFFFDTDDLEYTQAGGPQKFFNGTHDCGKTIHITTK